MKQFFVKKEVLYVKKEHIRIYGNQVYFLGKLVYSSDRIIQYVSLVGNTLYLDSCQLDLSGKLKEFIKRGSK